MNRNEITFFNIFDHSDFAASVATILGTVENKEELTDNIIPELQYCFWSRCEYEVIVSPWPLRDKPKEKIDVYKQVMTNIDAFIDYIWSKKETIYLYEGKLYYYES
jgi:hypothetical protein